MRWRHVHPTGHQYGGGVIQRWRGRFAGFVGFKDFREVWIYKTKITADRNYEAFWWTDYLPYDGVRTKHDAWGPYSTLESAKKSCEKTLKEQDVFRRLTGNV